MAMARILYQMAVAVLRALSPLLAFGGSKLARGVEGRRHAHEKLAAWGRTLRDPERPVVWLHAPSVGEGLQARAVKDALLARRRDVQIVYTHFSPSAEGLAEGFGADVAAYLPWDLRGPLAHVLDAVRPSLLVFTKTEVWPVLTAEAKRSSVPVAIVGATVPEGARRARWPARLLMRQTWAALDLACAISRQDAERLVDLGVEPQAVRTTGDPAVDSAAARFDAAPADAPHLRPFRGRPRPTVVAGSTWEPDEAVLLPAMAAVRRRVPELRLVVAPHEPHREHVEGLLASLRRDGWAATTLSELEGASATGPADAREAIDVPDAAEVRDAGEPEGVTEVVGARDAEEVREADRPGRGAEEGASAVVVDRVGVLAHLYGVASVSFVGGGFHDDGLHSVLEPAAAATPVVFGPRHLNARAAADLLAVGGAKIAANAEELADVVLGWLRDDEEKERTGRVAADYIEEHRGAAARTAKELEELLDRS